MAKESKKSHSRAHGMTQISISLPQRLVDKIDQLAEEAKRSRSNYIAYIVDIMPDAKTNSISFTGAAEAQEACKSR